MIEKIDIFIQNPDTAPRIVIVPRGEVGFSSMAEAEQVGKLLIEAPKIVERLLEWQEYMSTDMWDKLIKLTFVRGKIQEVIDGNTTWNEWDYTKSTSFQEWMKKKHPNIDSIYHKV